MDDEEEEDLIFSQKRRENITPLSTRSPCLTHPTPAYQTSSCTIKLIVFRFFPPKRNLMRRQAEWGGALECRRQKTEILSF